MSGGGRPATGHAGTFNASGGTFNASGGTFGAGGATGAEAGAPSDEPPVNDDCRSPVTRELAPFVEREQEDLPVADAIARASAAMVGNWRGFVSTPWTEPYQIRARFGADGTYSARCEQNSDYDGSGCCRAFYYGSDEDSPLKRWSLDSVGFRAASGTLDIAFCYDGGCNPPAWQGYVREVDYDQTGNRIRFDFWRGDEYGPLQVELERD